MAAFDIEQGDGHFAVRVTPTRTSGLAVVLAVCALAPLAAPVLDEGWREAAAALGLIAFLPVCVALSTVRGQRVGARQLMRALVLRETKGGGATYRDGRVGRSLTWDGETLPIDRARVLVTREEVPSRQRRSWYRVLLVADGVRQVLETADTAEARRLADAITLALDPAGTTPPFTSLPSAPTSVWSIAIALGVGGLLGAGLIVATSSGGSDLSSALRTTLPSVLAMALTYVAGRNASRDELVMRFARLRESSR